MKLIDTTKVLQLRKRVNNFAYPGGLSNSPLGVVNRLTYAQETYYTVVVHSISFGQIHISFNCTHTKVHLSKMFQCLKID